jgi:uncharacterized repeat protein (TIGR03803 family)
MSIHGIWPALAVLGAVMLPSLPAQPRPAATVNPIYAFQGSPDGAYPAGGVVADSKGSLYGVTESGGATGGCGCGVVYELTKAGGVWSSRVLYSFTGGTDAGGPYGPLVFDKSGNLYGTSSFYGANSSGTVFQLLAPASAGGPWTERVLYSFTGLDDGATPNGGLVFDANGVLYGSAAEGGADTAGTIFSLTPPAGGPDGIWTFNLLHSFTGGSFGSKDGSMPNGGLVFGQGGALYGTTGLGGRASSLGTVFQLAPPATAGGAWTENVLHDFSDVAGGSFPEVGLTSGTDGVLYGATPSGSGKSLYGTVFELAPPAETGGTWTFTSLANFGSAHGTMPSGVTVDKAGNLDGTAAGGSSNAGLVFELKPTTAGQKWKETVLQSLSGTDGGTPVGRLLLGTGGVLYGAALYGGDPNCNCGTVYEVIP